MILIRVEKTLLSSRTVDYPTITQGKTRIPGINDGEEFEITDVSLNVKGMIFVLYLEIFTNLRIFSLIFLKIYFIIIL